MQTQASHADVGSAFEVEELGTSRESEAVRDTIRSVQLAISFKGTLAKDSDTLDVLEVEDGTAGIHTRQGEKKSKVKSAVPLDVERRVASNVDMAHDSVLPACRDEDRATRRMLQDTLVVRSHDGDTHVRTLIASARRGTIVSNITNYSFGARASSWKDN